KLVLDTAEAPSQAKHSKAGKVLKKRKLQSTLQLVDEFVDEGIPADEPREPEPRKYEPLPETPKKKNSAEQFIFQRRTPAPTVPSSHEESSSLYIKLGLTDSKIEFDNEASHEGQTGSDPGKKVEDQAGSDLCKQVEGQAGSDPGVAADSQILPSHVVHAGPNLEHMNLEVYDTSPQPNPEQMDEEFTTTAYLNVQENLKLPAEGEVRLEEPASLAESLSSMKNLDKELT
ncbi:hypothetical protein Tco_1298751, partial [Tanacetum coccineum]